MTSRDAVDDEDLFPRTPPTGSLEPNPTVTTASSQVYLFPVCLKGIRRHIVGANLVFALALALALARVRPRLSASTPVVDLSLADLPY